MKSVSLITLLIAALGQPVAMAQSSAELQLFAQRTAPLNDQYDKWRTQWGDRHLTRRNDPDIQVLNFFELGEFDVAERTLSRQLGKEVRFGFDTIGSCRYQRVTLERMTDAAAPLGAKRWVARFTETVDLTGVDWRSAKISNLLGRTTLELNTNRTSAVHHQFEDLHGESIIDPSTKAERYEIRREEKERPENVLLFSANIDYNRMAKAADILKKKCPGRTTPF